MLSELTSYLFHHHKVVIPEIGCFELHQHAAQLDFAEKLLHPPYYSIQFSRNDTVDKKQFAYFPEESLEKFGKQLRRKIDNEEVEWSGIGKLSSFEGRLSFQPNFHNRLLTDVEANKIIRREEEHAVLRGEQEFSSTHLRNEKLIVKKRSYVILAAEIIGLIAIAYIVYHFYTNGLQPSSSGNQQTIEVNWDK